MGRSFGLARSFSLGCMTMPEPQISRISSIMRPVVCAIQMCRPRPGPGLHWPVGEGPHRARYLHGQTPDLARNDHFAQFGADFAVFVDADRPRTMVATVVIRRMRKRARAEVRPAGEIEVHVPPAAARSPPCGSVHRGCRSGPRDRARDRRRACSPAHRASAAGGPKCRTSATTGSRARIVRPGELVGIAKARTKRGSLRAGTSPTATRSFPCCGPRRWIAACRR